MDKILIGSHVSMSAPKYYLGSVEEAISYGANTLMFYTGAPQNAFRSPLEKLKIEEGRALLREHNFDETKIVVHAPYIINIANQLNHIYYLFLHPKKRLQTKYILILERENIKPLYLQVT